MSKYEPLKRLLESIQPTISEKSLSFNEIERILGFRLPNSAYEHRAWWSNPTSPTDHPYAQSWLEAGWKVDAVDQLDKRVHFRRIYSHMFEKNIPLVADKLPSPNLQKVIRESSSMNQFNDRKRLMNNEIELIQNMDYYYQMSLKVLDEFGGPSIYFHIQAIKEQKNNFLSNRHIEMIYATLASWGMHRMGDPDNTKAKMVEYDQFYNSIIINKDKLVKLINLRMDGVTKEEFSEVFSLIEPIYKALHVSISSATLVAHSKVLAHILPNLLPPIDRQYTIRFLTQDNKNFFTKSGQYKLVTLPNGIEKQYEDYLKYCIKIKEILDKCNLQDFEINPNTFNTSYPKIMDNVLMAFVKNVPKPNNGVVHN